MKCDHVSVFFPDRNVDSWRVLKMVGKQYSATFHRLLLRQNFCSHYQFHIQALANCEVENQVTKFCSRRIHFSTSLCQMNYIFFFKEVEFDEEGNIIERLEGEESGFEDDSGDEDYKPGTKSKAKPAVSAGK